MSWFFDTQEPWLMAIDDAPLAEEGRAWYARAVPKLAEKLGTREDRPADSSVVVARATVRTTGGPLGRAKPLLDALHDGRKTGPRYSGLGVLPPLRSDAPIAVELRFGSAPQVEYRVGRGLLVTGDQVGSAVCMDLAVPNWAAADSGEYARQRAAQLVFDQALAEAWGRDWGEADPGEAIALVIRHRPQRDEDNSWPGWLGALRRVLAVEASAAWKGWRPGAVASLTEVDLDCELRYEFYARR